MRTKWFERTTHTLSTIPGVQERFLDPAGTFYHAFMQAVLSENLSCLEPVLVDWIDAQPKVGYENQDVTILQILDTFLSAHISIAQEILLPEETIELTNRMLPVYFYAIEFVHKIQTSTKIDRVVEELEQANERVKRIEKSKADFISVAAHELKTPLTLIEGYSSMLDEHLSSNKADILTKQYLQGIETGYKRLREIVEDMIAVSMIDNHILTIHYQPLWLYSLFNILANEVKGVITDRNITLSIDQFPGSDEMTYGDGERLLQAFRKLVSNAIKYTPDGGSISVAGRMLPGYLEITVKDTGIGIDPDDQLRIFDKFGRLGDPLHYSSSKTEFKGGGPGLGLSITKGIIEAHGGAIWVESEGYDETRYNGSTFHVLLPLRKAPPVDKATQFVKLLGI